MAGVKMILIIVNIGAANLLTHLEFCTAKCQIAAFGWQKSGVIAATPRYDLLTNGMVVSLFVRLRMVGGRLSRSVMALHLEHLTWMPSPPLVPDEAIDLAHLKRMTLGEPALEDEVLSLFVAQSGDLMRRLNALPENAAALAHTLKGSARAIGAFRVADAALGVEAALRGEGGVAESLFLLENAVEEARTAIARLQGRA